MAQRSHCGRPIICDLGLARIVFDDASMLSHEYDGNGDWARASGINTTSAHTGTPRYFAREQVDLNHPSAPTTVTDMYAVGRIGFEVRRLLAHPTFPVFVGPYGQG